MENTLKGSESLKLRQVIISCMVGNALEWYDFVLYGYFAAIIGKLMFAPTHDTTSILLKSYGIFFSGFVMRPLGAAVFGYIGDRKGRRKALALSMCCMAFPTTLIGLLPTYEQVGLWAPILLTLLRLLQGLSMGGEFTGSMIFIVEHARPHNRGLMGSFASLSVVFGMIIGSAMASFMSFMLTTSQLEVWGWRIPFLLSSVGSVVGIYIRHHLSDPYEQERPAQPSSSQGSLQLLKELVLHHGKTMGRVVSIDMSIALGFFITCTYVMTYLQKLIGFHYMFTAMLNTGSMIVFALVIPVAGYASDRWSARHVMLCATIAFIVLSVPIFYGFTLGIAWIVILGHVLLAFIMGINFAPMPALLTSLFPAHVRYSGVSLAHNLSMAIFGGSAPEVLTFLIQKTHNLIIPGIVLLCAGGISLMGLLSVKSAKSSEKD